MVIGQIVLGLLNTDLLFFFVQERVPGKVAVFGQLSFGLFLCFITLWQTKQQEKHGPVGVGGTASAWQTCKC